MPTNKDPKTPNDTRKPNTESTDRNREPLRNKDRKDGKKQTPGTDPARATSDSDRGSSRRRSDMHVEGDNETRSAE